LLIIDYHQIQQEYPPSLSVLTEKIECRYHFADRAITTLSILPNLYSNCSAT